MDNESEYEMMVMEETYTMSRTQKLFQDIQRIEHKLELHEKLINVLLDYINDQDRMINTLEQKINDEEYYKIIEQDDIPH
jgi:hypothetical protein